MQNNRRKKQASFCFGLSLLLATVVAAPAGAVHPSMAYADCAELSQSNPEKALEMASEALKKHSDPSLLHCKAMALYGVKKFREAGLMLESLARSYETNRHGLALELWQQTYRAFSLASSAPDSKRALDAALKISLLHGNDDQQAFWLKERAEWHSKHGDLVRSIQYWDHILARFPARQEALAGRARALHTYGLEQAALADYTQLLALDPANNEARKALAQKASPRL